MNNEADFNRILPYGDTMNDGKVQVSFTLPVPDGDKGIMAALLTAGNMNLHNASVVHHKPLDNNFSFYVVYGSLTQPVNYNTITVQSAFEKSMSMDEINDYITTHFGRKLVVIGASTGTDAHTVGIDAILNMKGFAGHYGLERYEMMEVHNLGSQVPNGEFVKKAAELDADILLVSQTVTQKDIHIANLAELADMVEAAGIRSKVVLCCGGARISHELAKELGYDAGFGAGKFAEDVASFAVIDLERRGLGV